MFGHRVRDFRGLLWHLAARVLFTSFLSSVRPHRYTSLAPPDYSAVHKSLGLTSHSTSLCSHLPPTPSLGLSLSLSHAAHFSRVHFSSESFAPDSQHSLHVLLCPALCRECFQIPHLDSPYRLLVTLKSRCSQRDILLCLLLID